MTFHGCDWLLLLVACCDELSIVIPTRDVPCSVTSATAYRTLSKKQSNKKVGGNVFHFSSCPLSRAKFPVLCFEAPNQSLIKAASMWNNTLAVCHNAGTAKYFITKASNHD